MPEPRRSGGACTYAYLSQCPRDEYCTATAPGGTGTCQPLPGDGEPCVEAVGSLPCHPSAVCVEGTCQALGRIGDPCVDHAQCLSGLCLESECAATNGCKY